jgi:hypothetical protein
MRIAHQSFIVMLWELLRSALFLAQVIPATSGVVVVPCNAKLVLLYRAILVQVATAYSFSMFVAGWVARHVARTRLA